MQIDPRKAFYWHAFFLAVTTSFTEVNTVMPALILKAGGILTGVLVGAVGFAAVFWGAAAVALLALLPVRNLECGEWYREA